MRLALVFFVAAATAVCADPAKELAALEALPAAQRQSRAHHAALAKAQLDAGKHGPAAESLRVFEILPPAPADPDVEAVRKGIAKKALEEYEAAMGANAKGDTGNAVKAYLKATMLDPKIQAKDDGGLRDKVVTSLDNAVAKKPDDPALRFRHAMCAYLFGRLPESDASFDVFKKIEKDPYYAWRGGLWQTKVKAERTAMQAQDEQHAKNAAADRAKQAASDLAAASKKPASPSPGAAAAEAPADEDPETAAKRASLKDQIEKLDMAIAGASNTDAIKEAAGDYGKKYGKLIDKFVGSSAGQKKIEELKKQKEALEEQLANLK
jgi:hypothetical protein